MTSLLDVNVLVALFDRAHIHHEAAHVWFETSGRSGWATCPLTENGFARVISSPAYPGRRTTVSDALGRLRAFTDNDSHVFWDDSVSLRDAALVDAAQIGGARRITDVYLLALAVSRGGRLATLDRKLSGAAVQRAEPEHLCVIDAR